MSKSKPFILGALFGAALVYGGLQYHVVRSTDGFYVVPRSPQASLGLAYADIRNMSEEDLALRPELGRAMIAHSARKLLAKNDAEPTTDSLLKDGPGALNGPRQRLRSTTDEWNDLHRDGVPTPPPTSLEAPLWNPFAEDEKDEIESDTGSLEWPADDPVAAQFEGDSPFSDITDQLDKARDTFASRTRDLADQFSDQVGLSDRKGVQPFDYTEEPGRPHTTARPTDSPQPAVEPRRVPLLRDDQIRKSVNRRAREIYEESRRRASKPIDSLIDRSESRAASVIDELVSPPKSDDLIDRAASSMNPRRYRRER